MEILEYSTTSRGAMMEWIVPADSACQVGPVRDFQALPDCSSRLWQVGFVSMSRFEIPKLGSFLSTAPPAEVIKWMTPADSAC